MDGEMTLECGDKVVCVSNDGNLDSLTIGEVYTVADILEGLDSVIIEESGDSYPLKNFVVGAHLKIHSCVNP